MYAMQRNDKNGYRDQSDTWDGEKTPLPCVGRRRETQDGERQEIADMIENATRGRPYGDATNSPDQ